MVYLPRLDSGVRIAVEPDQVVDIDDQVATMIALRDDGKIGAFGLSAVKPYALGRERPVGRSVASWIYPRAWSTCFVGPVSASSDADARRITSDHRDVGGHRRQAHHHQHR
jgi:hypothetical protein